MTEQFPLNPYVAGQVLDDEYGFFGREDLVDKVIRTLTTTQHNSIVLHGQRRIGKTSFLHRLWRDETLRETYMPFFFDVQERQNLPLSSKLFELATTLIKELEPSYDLPSKDAFEDVTMFSQDILPTVLNMLGNKRLLILFDEFDTAEPANVADGYSAGSFLGLLQKLLNENQKQIAFIYVIGNQLDALAEGYRRLFRIARAESVGRLNQLETDKLMVSLGELGEMKYSDAALESIHNLISGHPFLAQLLGQEIFDRLYEREDRQVYGDDIEASIPKAMEHALGQLDWFWSGFDRDEQLVLAAIAELTEHQSTISENEIDQILQQHSLYLNDTTRRQALRQLIESDMLQSTSNRHFSFAVEFIRRWIIKTHSLKEVKSQIAEGSPQAQEYFRRGHENFQQGRVDASIVDFRNAIKIDPSFVDPRLGLARALVEKDKTSALEAYENAYELDPINTREELIRLREECIADLIDHEGHSNEIVMHARRVLQIDDNRKIARSALSDVYVKQARDHLTHNRPDEAFNTLKNLIDPWNVLDDDGIRDQVCKLWQDYSKQQMDRKPPHWHQAIRALDNLDGLGLLDETASTEYNKIILEQANDSLKKDRLKDVLSAFGSQLRDPFPVEDVVNLLLDYKEQQVEQQDWQQAADALEGLYRLVKVRDEESEIKVKDELINFYHQWGDDLLDIGKFDQVENIYGRGDKLLDKSNEFKEKICDALLQEATQYMNDHALEEAQACYAKAFSTLYTEKVKQDVTDQLSTYFTKQQRRQDWDRAILAVRIYEELNLSKEKARDWQAELYRTQAGTSLNQLFQVDMVESRRQCWIDAFEYLDQLESKYHPRAIALVEKHLIYEAQRAAWEDGAYALEKLRQLSDDKRVISLQANWLFNQAHTISYRPASGKDMDRARKLCVQILDETPDLERIALKNQIVSGPGINQNNSNLHHLVSELYVKLTEDLGQLRLDQGQSEEAQNLFEEALIICSYLEGLADQFRKVLITYSEDQADKGNWETAHQSLRIIQHLGIADPELDQLLIQQMVRWATHLFKQDNPTDVFSMLDLFQSDITDIHRETIRKMALEFSRFYAGRTRWDKARETLIVLKAWLTPKDDKALTNALDILNHEQLRFEKAKRMASNSMKVDLVQAIPHMLEELDIIERSFQDAEVNINHKPSAPNIWVQNLISTILDLGQAYLVTQKVSLAVEVYQKALDQAYPPLINFSADDPIWIQHKINIGMALAQAHLTNDKLPEALNTYRGLLGETALSGQHKKQLHTQISEALYNQAEKFLAESSDSSEILDKASRPLEQLKGLAFAAPYGEFPTDPRVDGAIQQVIIHKAHAQLKKDEIAEAFELFDTIPAPLPDTQIREIIWEYDRQKQETDNWPKGIEALKQLDKLLKGGQDHVFDQANRKRLVSALVQWGEQNEKDEANWLQAVNIYFDAVKQARDVAYPALDNTVKHYVQLNLRLAQSHLDKDPCTTNTPPDIGYAMKCYQDILALPEQTSAYHLQINQQVKNHAQKLATAKQWARSLETIDLLYDLYGERLRGNDWMAFEAWRWDFALRELKMLLDTKAVDVAFTQLDKFKVWLDSQAFPDAIWFNNLKSVKEQVIHFVTKTWLPATDFATGIRAFDHLRKNLPDDAEIIGWQAKLFVAWGKCMYEQDQFEDALTHYDGALKIVPLQEDITITSVETLQARTLLAQAQQLLNPKQPDLSTVVDIYKQVLLKRNIDPTLDLGAKIRNALRRYSKECTDQRPQNWEAARTGLACLTDLKLHDAQVTDWHKELILNEFEAKLYQDNIPIAYNCLQELERPWPVDEIQDKVHQYWQERLELKAYSYAIQSLSKLGDILAEDQNVRTFAVVELTDLAEQLGMKGNPQGKTEALEAAVALS